MKDGLYVPENFSLPEAIVHTVNNRANVILGRLALALEMQSSNNVNKEIQQAKEAAELLVAQVQELCKRHTGSTFITVDGSEYGLDDPQTVGISVYEKECIDKQIADENKLLRCERCDRLHKEVKAIVVKTGSYGAGTAPDESVPDEVEELCVKCAS